MSKTRAVSQYLSRDLDVIAVDAERVIDQEVADETQSGRAVQRMRGGGGDCTGTAGQGDDPVPDSLKLAIIIARLGKPDCVARGWALTGWD